MKMNNHEVDIGTKIRRHKVGEYYDEGVVKLEEHQYIVEWEPGKHSSLEFVAWLDNKFHNIEVL